MNYHGYRLLRVFVGLVVFFIFQVFFLNSDEITRVHLREIVYQQDICQDSAKAIELLNQVVDDVVSEDLLAEVYYRRICAHLDLGNDEDAEVVYREFSSRYSQNHFWMDLCRKKIPPDFLMQDLPWGNQESFVYKWEAGSGEVIGYSIVDISAVQNSETPYWEIHSKMIGDGFRQYQVRLDQKTLNPVYSNYQLRKSNVFEDYWMKTWISNRARSIQHDWDYEAIGLLLNVYQLRLGVAIDVQVYKPSEGGMKTVEVELTGVETLETHLNSIEACSRIEVRFSDDNLVCWLSNSEKRDFLQFEVEGFRGTLVSSAAEHNDLLHDFPPGLSHFQVESEQFEVEHIFLSKHLGDSLWVGSYSDCKSIDDCRNMIFGSQYSGYDFVQKSVFEEIVDAENFDVGYSVEPQIDQCDMILKGIRSVNGKVFEYVICGNIEDVEGHKVQLGEILKRLQLEDVDL